MFPLNAAAAAQPATINLTNSTISDVVSAPTDARAALIVSNDGITYQEVGIAPVRTVINAPDWLDPKIGMSLYEVFVTNAGPGTLDGASDVLSTWLSLGTERQWIMLLIASNQSDNALLTVQIRRVTTVLDTATYDLVVNTSLP